MKFLNFQIKSIYLETVGQTFNLHNFVLQKYSMTNQEGVRGNDLFEIILHAQVWHHHQVDATEVNTELKIIFRNVRHVDILDEKYDSNNFLGMQFVSDLPYYPTIVQQHVDSLVSDEKFRAADSGTEEQAVGIQGNEFVYAHFTGGVEFFISSKTVEVSFQQDSKFITYALEV